MEFSRPEYWMGSLSLLQGIFSTSGLNPGLPQCRQILYQLNHKGSPRILEWVAIPFLRGSSQPRDQPQVSRIAGRFFTSWATREAEMGTLGNLRKPTDFLAVILQARLLECVAIPFSRGPSQPKD